MHNMECNESFSVKYHGKIKQSDVNSRRSEGTHGYPKKIE